MPARVNLAVTDTLPLPFVYEGRKSPYYGGGKPRLAKTDTSKPVALRVTAAMRSAYQRAVVENAPDVGGVNGDSIVLRALMEAFIAEELRVTRTQYPPRKYKFQPSEEVVFLNCVVPKRVKDDFTSAVLSQFSGCDPVPENSDVLRELVGMYASGRCEGLFIPGFGKSRFSD